MWKLIRHAFGNEEFTLREGKEETVGRGVENTITLSSIVISRRHCVIKVEKNQILITDLKSSNGVYVGQKKIPPNEPFPVNNHDIIGFGWAVGAPLMRINNTEKYVFQLQKLSNGIPIADRIQYEEECNGFDEEVEIPKNNIFNKTPIAQKRKNEDNLCLDEYVKEIKKERNDEIILLSDSENEIKKESFPGNSKHATLEPIEEEVQIQNNIKFEAFDIKQEYIVEYDDVPIEINDDSDSELNQWYRRLSKNSPVKCLPKFKTESKPEDEEQNNISYSQQDDYYNNDFFEDDNNEDIFSNDIIIISEPSNSNNDSLLVQNGSDAKINESKNVNFANDITNEQQCLDSKQDEVDTIEQPEYFKPTKSEKPTNISSNFHSQASHKAKLIEPQMHVKKNKAKHAAVTKNNKIQKQSKNKSFSKSIVSKSAKEERKRKLRQLAEKERKCGSIEIQTKASIDNNSSKSSTYIKQTITNRSAFLMESLQIDKQTPNKEAQNKTHISDNKTDKLRTENIQQQKVKHSINLPTSPVNEDHANESTQTNKQSNSPKNFSKPSETSTKEVLTMKPLKDAADAENKENKTIEKSFSKVQMPHKPKKSVRFSEAGPIVHFIKIEPGNQMKETKLAKTYNTVNHKQKPRYSLDKINLIRILGWLPSWFQEQNNFNFPPPILGENVAPMTIFHKFESHKQYVKLIGNLILVEIWEFLTLAYMKSDSENRSMEMRIQSVPPPPTSTFSYNFYNILVDYKVASPESRYVPRVGDIVIVGLISTSLRDQRFFFVQDVRQLPSTSSKTHSFFCISLQGKYSDKTNIFKQGDNIIVKPLTSITKELLLFEAMDYLASSPLCSTILNPEPSHFAKVESTVDMNLQWMKTLNHSQQTAVCASVSSAMSERPSLQMIQGPPGTGKSSVICAIVKTYFYDGNNKKHQNRGKILICATSNAAVDELVIRLLNIRQKLPKEERFGMVRVGRVEAMHPRAQLVSSHQLALREEARHDAHAHHPAVAQEIAILEAKLNMWKVAIENAKDAGRIAYCQGRINEFSKKIQSLQSKGRAGGGLAAVERRIVEGADVIVTTLGSALNYKMRGLKHRIALCIIDEAGQAIEPETLIPLALDVKHVTLIGDPQQLPGYICSQRAKEHRLGESLFSRLTSCAEHWTESPVVLLNQQYRMHPDIVDYPNRSFYNSLIRTVYAPRPPIDVPPYCIVSVSSGDTTQSSVGVNETEAWGVARLAGALAGATRDRGLSLAIITPYNAQKDLIKENLRKLHARSTAGVEVNTVDSFQGQERDVVVVSVARTHGVGFLSHAGRTNVMLTRARHALLVCLDPHATLKNPQWRTLIEDAQQRNMYRVLPSFLCHPGNVMQIPDEQILKCLQTPR